MHIIVGCKLVPEEQDISVQPDGTLDTGKAAPKISQFDLNAIEAAVELKSGLGDDSRIVALSVGGKELENTKARKDILSRGPDELAAVITAEAENMLPHRTAQLLAAAAGQVGFDLIICGDGSGDLYAQQVGVRLGALLNVATVNGVSKIIAATAASLTVERVLEEDVETLEVPLPAVISVSTDINVPTIPGMKAVLGAGKKPVNVLSAAELDVPGDAAPVELTEIRAPKRKERRRVIIAGDGDDQIAEFVNYLRKIAN